MTDPIAPSVPPARSLAGDARADALRQRLDRLEGFLREDPSNQALLIDAFETALACGEWERAQFHLRHGQSLHADPLGWRLREGDFYLAQHRHDEAARVLEALAAMPQAPQGLADVLLHNLAFIDLQRGSHAECVARLAPVLDGAGGVPGGGGLATRALQQLWLRALHHDGQRARAVTWASSAERQGQLDTLAAGVASLIALDQGDFAAARHWSEMSVGSGLADQVPAEAFVTQAGLALASGDAENALQLADAALRHSPQEGRAWSTRAFALLLAKKGTQAQEAFRQAVSLMPDHIGTWHGLGWTQVYLRDLGAARASFESALALDGNFAESHGGLAAVLALEKSSSTRQLAERHAELALRLDRDSLSGRYAKALLDGRLDDRDDAQRILQGLLGGRKTPMGGKLADFVADAAADNAPKDHGGRRG